MGHVIMRALSSSDRIKKFDNELSSIRRGVKCGMVTSKVASCLGIQLIHADAMIRHLLSNSLRSRINRVMNADIFYQMGLSYDAYESGSYYFSDHGVYASGMSTQGYIRRFY